MYSSAWGTQAISSDSWLRARCLEPIKRTPCRLDALDALLLALSFCTSLALYLLEVRAVFFALLADNVRLLLDRPLACLGAAARLALRLLVGLDLCDACLALGRDLALPLLLRAVHRVDGGRVEHDRLGGELLQQRHHLPLAPLQARLERIGLKRVEVGLSGAGHQHGAVALGGADAKHVVVGTEADGLDLGAGQPVREVRSLCSARQPVLVNLHNAAVRCGDHAAIGDVERMHRPRRIIRVERLVGAHIPHLESAVASCRRHVPAGAVDGQVGHRALVAEHLDQRLVHIR
mmetsp:Transcript_53772/g.123719  ORF Transcript_53772/g.123719 Transcript_53772/m.123719 type:complete len:291 (-) Transcript_53772:92-964(-)